jgi:hypothetical protein
MKLARMVKALNNAIAYSGTVPLGVESDVMKLSSHAVVSRSSRYEAAFDDMPGHWANHSHTYLYAARPHNTKNEAAIENFVKRVAGGFTPNYGMTHSII